MDQTLIQHEFLRRELLCDAIRSHISMLQLEPLIKRGIFQTELIASFKLSRTTSLCRLINKCMKEQGFRMVRIQGYQYYKRAV